MVKLSWEDIKAFNEEDINVQNVDKYCRLFSDVELDDWNKTERLKHAFYLVQIVMNIKWEQYKLLEDSYTDKENEFQDVVDQMKELEAENAELQKAVRTSGINRKILDNNKTLEDNIQKLELELQSLKIINEKLIRDKETTNTEKSQLEKKCDSILSENQQLYDRCDYLQSLTHGKTSLSGKSNDDANYRKEISLLRAKIRIQKSEINNLEEEKESLLNNIKELESNLKQASTEIEQATNDYCKIKEALSKSDKLYKETLKECEHLHVQVSKLSGMSNQQDDTNDTIINAVEEKIEEWKEILFTKDKEVVNLYETIKVLKQEIQNLKLDSDKTSVRALVDVVKERENQILILKNQLSEATQELENNAQLLTEVNKQFNNSLTCETNSKIDRVFNLRQELEQKEMIITELKERLKNAEESLQVNANEIAMLEKQLKSYENNEYGLADAISDLKSAKLQIDSKERQLEEICRIAGQTESTLNEVNLENEHLRTQLGLDLNEPIDTTGYRRSRAIEKEEEKALNVVLQKEIENLEDERLELKRKLRQLARHLGQQCGQTDCHIDAKLLGEWNNDVFKSARTHKQEEPCSDAKMDVTSKAELSDIYQARLNVVNKELSDLTKLVETERKHKDDLKNKLDQVTNINGNLVDAMKEIRDQIKTNCLNELQALDPNKFRKLNDYKEFIVIDCPVMEKLLSSLDNQNYATNEDLSDGKFAKARIDYLEGANDELRRDLRETRLNSATYQVRLNQTLERLKELESKYNCLDYTDSTNLNKSDFAKSILPEDLSADAGQTILSLEEHLIMVLKDSENKNMELKELHNNLEDCRRKFAVCRHRQYLLYRDYHSERQAWNEEKQKFLDRIEKLETKSAQLEVYRTELDSLQTSLTDLKQGSVVSDEFKQKLGDLSRQITVLRVNEVGLLRNYTATKERENESNKQIMALKSDLIQLESSINTRLLFHSHHNEMTTFQLGKLQKDLIHNYVPKVELDRIKQDYESMVVSYKNACEKSLEFTSKQALLTETASCLEKSCQQCDLLRQELNLEREKRHSNQSDKENRDNNNNDNMLQIRIDEGKRVSLLELKEMHATERANHAESILQTISNANRQLETRNQELETQIEIVTQTSLDLEQQLYHLREELTDSVAKSVYHEIESKCSELENSNLKFKHEIESLKEITSISIEQNELRENILSDQSKEIQYLREQILNLESMDDAKMSLSRLHRSLNQALISENVALRKLSKLQTKIKHMETDQFKFEKRLADRDKELIKFRNLTRERNLRLNQTINLLRKRVIGHVSFAQYEKVCTRLHTLMTEQNKLKLAYEQVMEKQIQAESVRDGVAMNEKLTGEISNLFQKFNLDHKSKNELNLKLEHKLVEWRNRLVEANVILSAQNRQLERLKQQTKQFEVIVQSQENQLKSLELENVRLTNDLDQRETFWEQAELDYETNIDLPEMEELTDINNEVQNEVINVETSNFKLDTSLPVAQQLERTTQAIQNYSEIISKQKKENEILRTRIHEFVNLLRRQDVKFNQTVNPPSNSGDQDIINQLRITETSLRTNVEMLQKRLSGKEESLAHLNELLKQAYEVNESANQRHHDEIMSLQTRLHGEMEDAMHQLRKAMENTGSSTNPTEQTNLIKKIYDLEESLTEQNQVVIKQIKQAELIRQERDQLQTKYTQLQARLEMEKNELEDLFEQNYSKLNEECTNYQNEIKLREIRINDLLNENQRWKLEATKSPSVRQRQQMDRQRQDLIEKDKQIKALSTALSDLRQDFIKQSNQFNAKCKTDIDEEVVIKPSMNNASMKVESKNPSQAINKRQSIQSKQLTPKCNTDIDEEVVIKPPMYNACMKVESKIPSQELNSDYRVSEKLAQITEEKNHLSNQYNDLLMKFEKLNNSKMQEDASTRQSNEPDDEEIVCIVQEENNHLHMIPEKLCSSPVKIDKEVQVNTEASMENEWNARKRLENELVKLKEKLNSKGTECAKIQKQLDLTKSQLDRINKQNEILRENVVKNWGPGFLPDSNGDTQVREPLGNTNRNSVESVAQRVDLHAELERLKTEVIQMKQLERLNAGLPMGNKIMNADALHNQTSEAHNEILTDRIKHLEQQLVDRGLISENKLKMDQVIQNDLLRLNKENLELKFELENLRSEIPLMKIRIHDLQTYVNLLKEEKEALRTGQFLNKSFGSDSSTMTTIRKIGESGRSTKELEKIIVRLKKLLKQSQIEIEQLKCTPGPVSQEELGRYRAEIKQLKQKLDQAEMVAGSKLTGIRQTNEMASLKLMNEYESLRHQYERVLRENDSLREKLRKDEEH